MTELSMKDALDVFLQGFSITRSFTRPYPVNQVGPSFWLLRDGTVSARSERTPELISYPSDVGAVLETRKQLGLKKHMLCVLLDDAGEAEQVAREHKQLGYRFLGREPFFVLDLAQRERFPEPAVVRITTAAGADMIAKASRSRQILPEHLTDGDSVCRLYAAFDGDNPVGWVKSVRTHDDRTWVAGLFVQQPYRRRGIGRALMSAMLDDDEKYGARWSVLLASLTGAMLYPRLGYLQRGLLLIFAPKLV